jgi:hypothetical protein
MKIRQCSCSTPQFTSRIDKARGHKNFLDRRVPQQRRFFVGGWRNLAEGSPSRSRSATAPRSDRKPFQPPFLDSTAGALGNGTDHSGFYSGSSTFTGGACPTAGSRSTHYGRTSSAADRGRQPTNSSRPGVTGFDRAFLRGHPA